ncbi:MFS transporter [Cupriavidus plantarum]|uniref:MFS transporter n=1 Tax=Cupriavidus plantarum TaxID=942865 RepID=UPI00339D705A
MSDAAIATSSAAIGGLHPQRQHWAAVFAIAFTASVFCTTEFMPVGLLRYIALGLSVSEGAAGWTVSAPGLLAALAAPAITLLAGRLDRRWLLGMLGMLLVLSNLTAALAPSFAVLVLARVMFGVGLGGFWAIGAGLGARLVDAESAPRATAIIFAGVSAGMLVGGAAGALIGELWHWRAAFWLTAALSLAALAATMACLPPLRVAERVSPSSLLAFLRGRQSRVGLLVMAIALIGQFAAYTYVTPFLSHVAGFGGTAISSLLFGYTLVGMAGNFVAGAHAGHRTRATLLTAIGAIALSVLPLAFASAHPAAVLALMTVWGIAYGAMPVALQVWMAKASAQSQHEAGHEAGMALFVTNFQLSIAMGAWMGGQLVDRAGVGDALTLAGGAVLLAFATLGCLTRPAAER